MKHLTVFLLCHGGRFMLQNFFSRKETRDLSLLHIADLSVEFYIY